MTLGVGMPAIVVACTALGAITGQTGLIVPGAIALIAWIFTNSIRIFVHWPTAIRIDETGLRIGNVSHPPRTPRRRLPTPSLQAYQVFSTTWPGVLSMRVSTDRRELRHLGKQNRFCYLGMLTPPLMRAALIVEIDPEYATYPEFRKQHTLTVASSDLGTKSRTWTAPTRHPHQLAQAVAAITNSPRWNARRMG